MLPQITFIYDRYHKASPKRQASVEMRITYEGKQKYISTGIMLYPNQWKKGVITNVPDALVLSEILSKMLTDVRQVLLKMIEGGNVDIYAIPSKLRELHNKNVSFIEFCIQRAEIRKYGKGLDTQERYNRFLRLFRAWGKILSFEDLNESSIIEYDKYLKQQGMRNYSKWNNYHRFLNSFIIDAIDEGYLNKNPYRWINIDKDKNSTGIERCLTPIEFKKIKDSKMPTASLEKVRDTFIFQTYTCLSYTDLKNFDASKIQQIKGTEVYIGKRGKTGKPFTIPLLSPALSILYKYGNTLPIISNVKYNNYLKLVAQASGIDKPISTHWARHTGATLLLNEGVDIKIVSKICGHSSTRITEQVYAKLLDETVINAVKRL